MNIEQALTKAREISKTGSCNVSQSASERGDGKGHEMFYVTIDGICASSFDSFEDAFEEYLTTGETRRQESISELRRKLDTIMASQGEA